MIVPDRPLGDVANFKETQLARMRPGQTVNIEYRCLSWGSLSRPCRHPRAGRARAFSLLPPENATGNFVKVVQRVPVKIVFDDTTQRRDPPWVPACRWNPTVRVR